MSYRNTHDHAPTGSVCGPSGRRRRSAARRTTRRAFTLIEMIVVVTIIALLATMVAPRLWRNIGTSKQKVARADVQKLANQVRLYCMDNGMSKPSSDFELEVLLQGPEPYLDKKEHLLDPWDRPYMIVVPGVQNVDFDIVSFGGDGVAGGEGEDADIYN